MRFRGLLRSFYFLPVVMSQVAVAFAFDCRTPGLQQPCRGPSPPHNCLALSEAWHGF